MRRRFMQVDVFTDLPYLGNPVAVVLDGEGLSDEEMQRIANWVNLSETTFVLPPTIADADYRVRIFTPSAELPFAGHPTLGTCHAWLESGGQPASGGEVIQECGVGAVAVRGRGSRLAFAAPPLIRSGPVDVGDLAEIANALGISEDEIVDANWADNGAGWVGVLVDDVEALRGLKPRLSTFHIGVAARSAEPSEHAYEVRVFFPSYGKVIEDPVTGSFNASLAQWLMASGRAEPPYVIAQGGSLGRAGRVHIDSDETGSIWVGGDTITCVEGHIEA